MTGAASRRRGHDAERTVARWLREHGFPDARTSRAELGRDGGRQAGDIVGVPGLCISVKDVAASAFPTWLRQAEAEAEPAGLVPVVVRRTRGNPDVGEWVAVIPSRLALGSRPFRGSCRATTGAVRSVEAHLDRTASWPCSGEGCPPLVYLDGYAPREWIATRFSHVVAGMAP